MSQLPNPRQIKSSDFKKEDKETVDKLAFILNKFMNDVARIVNGNVDFTNLSQEIVTLEVTVDGSGLPVANDVIRKSIPRVQGIVCVRAQNVTTATNYPTSQPFINYYIGNDGLLRFSKITGLVANEKYKLTLLLL